MGRLSLGAWRSCLDGLPLRVRRLGVRTLTAGPNPAITIETDPLGFLGATEEDQARWVASFRHLLDGLEAPLQVVMTFRPGGGVPAPRPTPAATASRARDLDHLSKLESSASAQARTVTLVTGAHAAPNIHRALAELGVAVRQNAGATTARAGEETPKAFRDSDGWHRTWYVHRFPGVELEPGWALSLIPPGLSIALAWHVEPLPSAWIVAYLQRQLAQMRARHLDQDLPSHTDPILAGALPQAADLQRRIAASEERAFNVAVYLTLSAPSPKELDEGGRMIDAAAAASLCQIQPCWLRMADGHLATLPLGVDRIRRRRLLDTSSLTTLFPWLDSDLRDPDGLIIGTSRATGSPVVLDPFDDRRRANANIGVFGHSGAGKTYLLSALAMGMLGTGGQVFIIDPEREYGALAESLGGAEINLTLGSGQALNVLQRPPPAALGGAQRERWLGPAVADALDLIAVLCGDLDESDRALVEAAIRRTYQEVEEPVLADVAGRMPPASRPATILSRWVAGSLGAMFSAPTNVDLDAPIVAFAMRELREELVAPVHFLLAEALWTRIKARRRRRLLVVDELGLLFDDPTIRRFVVNLARRIRKYDGGLVFATQNPGDLLTTDAGSVVATNPAVHLFGAQRPGEAAKLQRAFHLSDVQRTALEGARRGEFLLLAGGDRMMVEVKAPPWQEAAMQAARAP